MDKNAVKKFAVNARRKLIDSVSQKAYGLGISINDIKEVEQIPNGSRIKINNDYVYLTDIETEHRERLIEQIEYKGYEQVMEEVAYTWFNRIIAIRFMEVNDYLPTRIRVLSSEDENKVEPDAVTQALDLVEELGLDREKIYNHQDNNDTEGLFKYIFIKQCNALGKIMPVMFEKIQDYTELLLPDNLLVEGSVIRDLINDIKEDDFKEQVEIIGWLYQYYISEKKKMIDDMLKKTNNKVTKENLPAKTQQFTPAWIVKYMVENSLGRLWLEGHKDESLKNSWKYYLEEVEQDHNVEKELEKIKEENKRLTPEDITVLDPAMGSGHILVYAFDILYQIYLSVGYTERDIPRLILEKNLYGLDIDDRAGQLAYFALIMKARSYSRKFFRDIERNPIELNICSIQESNEISEEDIKYLSDGNEDIEKCMRYLVGKFIDAKEYGSILEIEEKNFDNFDNIEQRLNDIQYKTTLININKKNILYKIKYIVKQSRLISKKYNICITNPPYMGRSAMNEKLGGYLDFYYKDYKYDLFSVFIKKGFDYIKTNGFNAMVTMQSWMFLSSFERFRKYILDNKTITSIIHMGNNVMGIAFGTCTFILRNTKLDYTGIYNFVASDDLNEEKEPKEFPIRNKRYVTVNSNKFYSIPGIPIAYWVSDKVRKIFYKNEALENYAKPKQGMATANNNKFLRRWSEVAFDNIGFNYESNELAAKSGLKWFPYNKGGDYRKWYGNNEYVVNWENDGYEIKKYKNSAIRNSDYYFKRGITWTLISSSNFGIRYTDKGFLFDVGGSSAFPEDENLYYIIGLLSSKLAINFLKIQNPTLNFQVGNIANIPIIKVKDVLKNKLITNIVKECIDISKKDWDSFEISWNLKKNPIIEFKSSKIENSFKNWSDFAEKQFNQLKSNEEELNKIFIDIYELQDELTPEVEDKDITIRKADRDREMKSFISYAVGCMMGRYCLDEEGLVFAGGKFDINRYKTFKADKDAIIPITDMEYFEDDIVSKFVEFVKVVFGGETLEENLNYIADTECFKRKSNETSRDCLRRYFLKGFMEDHIKVYQKRPIYWLFDSGKQNGFKVLIYMHRYDENMVAKVRADYLHVLQRKYESEINRLDNDINSDILSTKEKTAAKKRKEKIQKQLSECKQYDQVIAHVAHQRITIDLDDGVKVNYQKFQGIEVPQGDGKKDLKQDLLFKVKM